MRHTETTRQQHTHSRAIGLLIIVAGLLLLASKIFTGIPVWLFSWPMLIVGFGLLVAISSRLRNPLWIVLVFWGTFGILDSQVPEWHLHDYNTPAALICLGAFFLFRIRRRKQPTFPAWEQPGDMADVTAVLGNRREAVVDKAFKGVDITAVLGNVEMDLRNADFEGEARIDITCFMGGAKLLIPADWTIKTDTVVIMGGINDKRMAGVDNPLLNTQKILILDGTVIMGGIEVGSY